MFQRVVTVAAVFPHQLFRDHPALTENPDRVVLIEDPLFFSQYRFHIQKLLLHRLSMDGYAAQLASHGFDVHRIYDQGLGDEPSVLQAVSKGDTLVCADPVDDWLERSITRGCEEAGATLRLLETPMFLSDEAIIERHFEDASPYMARFYQDQRKRLGILLDEGGGPLGGSWSYDPENRKKLPKDHVPPAPWTPSLPMDFESVSAELREAYPDALGTADEFCWPVTRDDALHVLNDFVENRLSLFGDYEDAVDPRYDVIYHSTLTPALNIGLLSPREVVDALLEYAEAHPENAPLNSVEGFIRQVIGWREFMAATYRRLGRRMRTENHFGHTRPMPATLYDGSTGIEPLDTTIRKVLRFGYAHHIERLMILGNFMVLAEIHPDEVYRWFMELFVDAYDWVMVPNVYGMSQYADGGLITTKPYVSGSNYLRKMTRYPKGDWCDIWDGLYWRFIEKHRPLFESNPRLAMMTSHLDRMGEERLGAHKERAADFLARLHAADRTEFL